MAELAAKKENKKTEKRNKNTKVRYFLLDTKILPLRQGLV